MRLVIHSQNISSGMPSGDIAMISSKSWNITYVYENTPWLVPCLLMFALHLQIDM